MTESLSIVECHNVVEIDRVNRAPLLFRYPFNNYVLLCTL